MTIFDNSEISFNNNNNNILHLKSYILAYVNI